MGSGHSDCSTNPSSLYLQYGRLSNKRYFKIDQHLARYFVYYVECLSLPFPFLCSQIITPLIQLSQPIRKRGWNFQFLLYQFKKIYKGWGGGVSRCWSFDFKGYCLIFERLHYFQVFDAETGGQKPFCSIRESSINVSPLGYDFNLNFFQVSFKIVSYSFYFSQTNSVTTWLRDSMILGFWLNSF